MPVTAERDYDAEFKDTADHRYAYDFDLDVMHKYMVRSFDPFFRTGSLLEMGSFKGDFTRRLLPYFEDITCVEASGEAIAQASATLPDRVQFHEGLFETIRLPRRYDNIVLTHVLEHLDDPVGVLLRVREEWLTDKGRLLLVCPNANAPSRQIAVKMGLISHNAAITPAEATHGHRHHLQPGYAGARRARRKVERSAPVGHLLQILCKFPMGSHLEDRHRDPRISGWLLHAGPAIPRPLRQHLFGLRGR